MFAPFVREYNKAFIGAGAKAICCCRRRAFVWPAIVTVVFVISISGQIYGRKLVFRDEFTGHRGNGPDVKKWSAEIGGSGWGNQELEYYTASTDNAYLDGAGSLVIKANKLTPPLTLSCWYGQCRYTSGRLLTKGKFDLKYGRFEARIKIPRGQGVWPAFWLLGNNIDSVGWPACGEIDIMENIGKEPSVVHGTMHGPGYSGANGIGAPFLLPNDTAFAEGFHVFAVDWSANEIHWYVDGADYKTVNTQDLPAGTQWVFDHPFFIILNFAVGGSWPGSPDATTTFPQTMMIDYVRVYRR